MGGGAHTLRVLRGGRGGIIGAATADSPMAGKPP
jgi:hypothetical protein